MNPKQLTLLGGAALLGGAPAVLARGGETAAGWDTLAAPAQAGGGLLRQLSLSGFAGNLAAWGVTALVCALPLALLVWPRRAGGRGREDWLLALLPPLLFALIYYSVNPTLLEEPASTIFPLAALGTALSVLAAWLILKLLRGLDGASADRLAGAFRPLLTACAALLVFGAVFGRLAGLLADGAAVVEGNSPMTGSARFTLAMLIFFAALKLIPDLLAGLTLLWGAELAGVLGRAAFGEEAVALCQRTAASCRRVAQITVLLAVFTNLLQLLLLSRLHSSSFSVTLPLFSLMLSAGLFLLCRCLQRGQQLQDDSDSII